MQEQPPESYSLNLSQPEIELRKRWLELAPDDEQLISSEIHHLLHERVDELMDSMYEHFLSFEETRSFFPDERVLQFAKSAQADYFRRLTKGNYDAEYVRDRLQVGYAHYRIELDPKWYIGAYNRALSWLIPVLLKEFKDDCHKQSQVVSALFKLIFFDMGLAIESYTGSKEFYIRKHRDTIRELETEKRVTKGILEGAPIGIVTLNNDFICLECNEEFMDIINKADRADVIGQRIFDLAPYLDRSMFQMVLQSGQPLRGTAQPLHFSTSQNRDERYWDWAAWPIKGESGSPMGLVSMFSNATDRVQLQQQREDFVATLTHDLKTPVLATNRAVKFLLDGDFGPIAETQREILETIHQSNSALYSLVQTLLEVYRFDSGVKELHLRRCNLGGMVSQMLTEIMPLASEKGVQLTASIAAGLEDIECDDEEMRRVVQNLIDNSLKFTPSGGTITVSLYQSAAATTLSVADTGRGIPEENKPKLFQRFWQAGSTGRYYASTGLGLYLCRRIVEAHGGKIWCESTEGKGSTFYVELVRS